jgi:VWFA-related protein
MNLRRWMIFAAAVCLTGGLSRAQKDQAPADSGVVLRTETRVVLVDAVVTGKKGEYVRDLKAKDFKVFEDGKEQAIKSFTFEADPGSPAASQNRYLVLFFDASTMNPGDQIQARQAAGKFVDSNAGPNHLMAVVNFTGAVQIAQNFTANVDRLKSAVSGVRLSSVSANDTEAAASPQLNGAMTRMASNFAAQDLLLSIEKLAKALSVVPGRKSLVLLTAGFKMNAQRMSEITAVVDACNKANVAIYPIDVRGLTTMGAGMPPRASLSAPRFSSGEAGRGFLQLAAYSSGSVSGLSFVPQHGGGTTGGGTAGGGTAGGGAAGGGGGRSGGAGPAGGGQPVGGTNAGAGAGGSRGGGAPAGTNPGGANGTGGRGGGAMPANIGGVPTGMCQGICNQRSIVPVIPPSATDNQQLMYALADGTGGFVIKDTNDLLGGMQKIGQEQDEYYILGYTPKESAVGTCHVLKVQVDRSGTSVRARTGYCNVKSADLLTGSTVEKTLETRASAAQAGSIAASMQLPYFYTAPNVARVEVAMDIASQTLKFQKEKGKLHGAINILGIANGADGGVAARFSDTVNFDFGDEKEVDAFREKPVYYENQFDIAPGHYNLKVVFTSGGEQFGKLEMPLTVDPYQDKEFAVSGLALSKEVRQTSAMGLGLDALLLEDKKPLIVGNLQVVPSGTNEFKKPDLAIFYCEVYEPLLVTPDPKNATAVGIKIRVLDRKTGEQKEDTGFLKVDPLPAGGNPVIPLAYKMPVANLVPGSYQLEFSVEDTGGKLVKRTADFEMK